MVVILGGGGIWGGGGQRGGGGCMGWRGGEKTGGWIAIGVGEGGVGGLGRLRVAESWWEKSRVSLSSLGVFTWISGSRVSSSEGGEGLGVESEGLSF